MEQEIHFGHFAKVGEDLEEGISGDYFQVLSWDVIGERRTHQHWDVDCQHRVYLSRAVVGQMWAAWSTTRRT